MRQTKVFAGSSHPELSQLVANKLGLSLAECILKKFSNKETSIELGKEEKKVKSTFELYLK
jgi:ribose-phosphate pyrophosphokinase